EAHVTEQLLGPAPPFRRQLLGRQRGHRRPDGEGRSLFTQTGTGLLPGIAPRERGRARTLRADRLGAAGRLIAAIPASATARAAAIVTSALAGLTRLTGFARPARLEARALAGFRRGSHRALAFPI